MSFRSLQSDNEAAPQVRYIYDLPYHERKLLSQALDINNKWEELGGTYMKFDYPTMFKIGQAVLRSKSPTDELLDLWGSQNHTVLELFKLLWKMKNYQAMKVLKPFIDEKYHYLIYEGENNVEFSRTQSADRQPNSPRTSAKRDEVLANNPQNSPPGQLSPPRSTSEDAQGSTERKMSELSLESCTPHIPYRELEVATNFWDKSNILGRGGFGVVFKGIWKNTAVAIKRLESQKANESAYNAIEIQKQQSLKELQYLNTYRHDNILPLYGYSIGGEKPCLIYQFMPNGSLEDRIQCRQRTKPLSWLLRANIATGVARGLQFLHGMEKPLVHGDIKSANILLDQYFVPKIGDFGLAKEGPVRQYTHVQVTRIHGTRPYLPDEFLRGKKLSTKVDTYSFGVVLCELATGLKAYDDSRENKYLRDHVHYYEENSLISLMDSKAGSDDSQFFSPLIHIGKKCSSQLPKERPTMVDVLKDLDGVLAIRKATMVAKANVRRDSAFNPSNPLEAQMLHEYHAARRLSLAPPSSSYQFQHWLYPSPAPSKQPLYIPLSTSPTHPVASQPFPILSQVPETCSGSKQVPVENPRPHEINIPIAHVTEQPVRANEPMAASPSRHPENRYISPQINVESYSMTQSEDVTETDASTSMSSFEEQKSCAPLAPAPDNTEKVDDNFQGETNVEIPLVSKLGSD